MVAYPPGASQFSGVRTVASPDSAVALTHLGRLSIPITPGPIALDSRSRMASGGRAVRLRGVGEESIRLDCLDAMRADPVQVHAARLRGSLGSHLFDGP